jgi:predicted AAA+ superfamily ATPase
VATANGYRQRLIDPRLRRLFNELPALMITGPRATGKTTTAARLARTIVRLDRSADAAAFAADPDAALRAQTEPVLLDEWQAVPGVLGAVKRAVDDNPRPGRFLLTGSVRADLDAQTWPGTGRIVRLRMYGLTQRELAGDMDEDTFLDKLARGDLDAFTVPEETPDLLAYIERALASGYPEPALNLSTETRAAWLSGYLEQLITRDAEGVAGNRDPGRLRRYFEALALNTAGQPEHRTLYEAAQINRATAHAYDALLTNLFVIESIPAWAANRLTRLIKTPKRYLVDPGLVGPALGLDPAAVIGDGDLLGRLIDTFVLMQLRPELELAAYPPRLFHLRDKAGRHEIDLVAELSGGRVLAIEIKSTAAPSRYDARHLEWLRAELGDRFVAGAVLHTGPGRFRLGERINAIPIAAIWGPQRSSSTAPRPHPGTSAES